MTLFFCTAVNSIYSVGGFMGTGCLGLGEYCENAAHTPWAMQLMRADAISVAAMQGGEHPGPHVTSSGAGASMLGDHSAMNNSMAGIYQISGVGH